MQKSKKSESKGVGKVEGAQLVAEVFSISRDLEALNPYHMDGDIEMYSEQNLQKRQKLRQDDELSRQINNIIKFYRFREEQGKQPVVDEIEYKRIQKILAKILRPQIDQEELEFVVDQDWQYDRLTSQTAQYYVSKQKLCDALFQLIDVWTLGSTRQQYLSFVRLLKKKIERALK